LQNHCAEANEGNEANEGLTGLPDLLPEGDRHRRDGSQSKELRGASKSCRIAMPKSADEDGQGALVFIREYPRYSDSFLPSLARRATVQGADARSVGHVGGILQIPLRPF
jgi:hypothetical protein